MAFPFITAEQAAEFVKNGDNVGFSGFTAAGTPKFVAPAIAAKAKRNTKKVARSKSTFLLVRLPMTTSTANSAVPTQ